MSQSTRHADGNAMAVSPQFGREDSDVGADRAPVGRGRSSAAEGTSFSFDAPRRSVATVDSRLDTVRSRLREMMAARDESSDGSGLESRGASGRPSASVERLGSALRRGSGVTTEHQPTTVPGQLSPHDLLTAGTRVVGRDACAKIGQRVCIIDPSIARFVEPTGSIVEVRCGGERVQVEHDGPDKQHRYYNTGKNDEYQLTFVDSANLTGAAEKAPAAKTTLGSIHAEALVSSSRASTYAERRRSTVMASPSPVKAEAVEPNTKVGVTYAERRRSSANGQQLQSFSQAASGEAQATIGANASPGSKYAERRRSSTSVSHPVLSARAPIEEAETVTAASASARSKYAERRLSSARASESDLLVREPHNEADIPISTRPCAGSMYAEKRRSTMRASMADLQHEDPKPLTDPGTSTGSSYAARRFSGINQQEADPLPPPAPWEEEAQPDVRPTARSSYAERRRSSASSSKASPLPWKSEVESESVGGAGLTYAERRRSSVSSPVLSRSASVVQSEEEGRVVEGSAQDTSRSCQSRRTRGSLPAPPPELPADVNAKQSRTSSAAKRAACSSTCSDICEVSADGETEARRTTRCSKAKQLDTHCTASCSLHTGSPGMAVSSGFREEYGRLRSPRAKILEGQLDLHREGRQELPWNRREDRPHDDDSGSDTDTGFAPACKSVLGARMGSRALPENKSLNDMKTQNVVQSMSDSYNQGPFACGTRNAEDLGSIGLDKLQQDHEDIVGRLRSVEDSFSRNVIALRKELREWVDDSERRVLARMFEEVDKQIRQAASTAVSRIAASGKYSPEVGRDDTATSLNEEPEQEVESEAGAINKPRHVPSKEDIRHSPLSAYNAASSSPASSAELADSTRRLEAIGSAARRVSASLECGAAGPVPPSRSTTDPLDPSEMSRLSELRQFARGVLSGGPAAFDDRRLEALQASSECGSVPTAASPCAHLRDLASSSDMRGGPFPTPCQFGRSMPPQEFHIGSARGSRGSRSTKHPISPHGGEAPGLLAYGSKFDTGSANADLESDGEYWQDGGADFGTTSLPPRRSPGGGSRRSVSSQWVVESRGGGRSVRRQASVSAGVARRDSRHSGGENWDGAPGGQAQGWGMIF